MMFGYSFEKRALVYPDPTTGKPRYITACEMRQAFVTKSPDGEPIAWAWKASDADLEKALPAIDRRITLAR